MASNFLTRKALEACQAAISALQPKSQHNYRYQPLAAAAQNGTQNDQHSPNGQQHQQYQLPTINSDGSNASTDDDCCSHHTEAAGCFHGGLKQSPRSRWSRIFLVATTVLFVMACASSVPSMRNRASQAATQWATPSQMTREQLSKQEYIAAVLANPVEGLLDPKPIRKMCNETVFQEGLIWHCGLVNGGIGNVGNMWLNCVRYAIEAGATSIILPRMGARSADNLGDLGSGDHSASLDVLYDVDYFVTVWPQICPQMRVFRSESDVPDLPTLKHSVSLTANDIGNLPNKNGMILDATGWRPAFDQWLEHYGRIHTVGNMSAENPVRVVQRIALSNWNRESQIVEFADSFPRLFRFPTAFRRLAATALWNLEQKTGRPAVSDAILFPSASSYSDSSSTSLGKNRVADNSFLGAHLRVASDAVKAGWPGYNAQAPAYLDEAQRRNLSTIYLATGSAPHRDQFSAEAAARGLQVITKEELLDELDLAELKNMTWDQQAIVDFEILLHSTFFTGFVRSSFSWTVAIRRGILPEAGTPVVTRRQFQRQRGNDEQVEKYRDGMSVVMGRYDKMTIEGIWP